MQKKLIALAVAGLLSAPAFAQSNVTIYGTVDYGYTLQNRNVAHGVDSRQGVDSGISKASRIGFKVVEDLGNGLKVVGVLENGLAGDTTGVGILNGTARQSYAALAGGFGTVAFGRHYTPQHLFQSAVDPFAANGIGSSANVLSKDTRLSNLVAYISPSWGGFSFIAAYTNSYEGQENNENRGSHRAGYTIDQNTGTIVPTPAGYDYDLTDTRVIAFAPSFATGGLFVAANYHQAKFNEPDAPAEHLRVLEGYASYDFGPVKIGGLYGQRVTKDVDTRAVGGVKDDIKVSQLLIGATFKISANDAILASFSRRTVKTGDYADIPGLPLDKLKLDQWALGYEHSLSKRTTLYAQYVGQRQNNAQKIANERLEALDNAVGLGGVVSGLGGVVGYNSRSVSSSQDGIGGTGYRQGLAVGVRHDF
ncbi:MAG: porin [Azoarcus sp.]|jgi:predicted porin|nr:porin [Azoarcus sp.]